jgi:hypothetical protein
MHIEEKAGGEVSYEVGGALGVEPDDGQPGRHALERHLPEGLGDRRRAICAD